MRNLQISIPITIVAALLALAVLWGLISTLASRSHSSIELTCASIQSVVVVVIVRRRQLEGVGFCAAPIHTIALMIASNPLPYLTRSIPCDLVGTDAFLRYFRRTLVSFPISHQRYQNRELAGLENTSKSGARAIRKR